MGRNAQAADNPGEPVDPELPSPYQRTSGKVSEQTCLFETSGLSLCCQYCLSANTVDGISPERGEG